MPVNSSTEQESDDSDTFVEIDPTGRYGRVSTWFHILKSLFLIFSFWVINLLVKNMKFHFFFSVFIFSHIYVSTNLFLVNLD